MSPREPGRDNEEKDAPPNEARGGGAGMGVAEPGRQCTGTPGESARMRGLLLQGLCTKSAQLPPLEGVVGGAGPCNVASLCGVQGA